MKPSQIMKITKEYKDYIIYKGNKEIGIMWDDIKNNLLTPAQFKEFKKFMHGQTMGMVGSESIVFTEDFMEFIKNNKLK